MYEVVLEGGPSHGKCITLDDLQRTFTVAYAPPLPVMVPEEPRPPWWRHPLRWLRWSPPSVLSQPLPKPEHLAYRDTGETRDGRHVFRAASDWPWFKGPEAASDDNLYRAMMVALYAVHPLIRQDALTRWVMNLEWYRQLRATLPLDSDPAGDDPAKWEPNPDDCILGIRIMVTDDGGAPHLENRRYPATYPG